LPGLPPFLIVLFFSSNIYFAGMSELHINHKISSPKGTASEYYQKWRLIKDKIAQYGVVIGGLSVIIAVVLIFFFLLYSVYPLFISASAKPLSQYAVPEQQLGKTVLLAMEEQNKVGARFTDTGTVIFFKVTDGETIGTETIKTPTDAKIISFSAGNPATGVAIYGLSNGKAIVVKQLYKETFVNNIRQITPSLQYPLGVDPIIIDATGLALDKVAIKISDKSMLAAKIGHKIQLVSFAPKESLFDDEAGLTRTDTTLEMDGIDVDEILIDKEQRYLYLIRSNGGLSAFDISNKAQPVLLEHKNIANNTPKITSATFLNGDLSVLVGDSNGTVSQWGLVKDEQNHSRLNKFRDFKVSDQSIIAINAEQRRKGFIAVDANSEMGVYHSTSERELLKEQVSGKNAIAMTLSPRADTFLLQTSDGLIHFWHIENEHPEVSIKVLWQQIWYESYSKPAYIWQSSSASNDFEPKYSLIPLVFGTLKAAFYSMLFAVPLSLMGAIYTAYFMAPSLRRVVKPTIEMMGALPTVILGFLAGLWLAPYIEMHLAGIFTLLLVIPTSVILFAYLWQFLPQGFLQKIPEGWDAMILIPIILLSGCLAIGLSDGLETICFNGSLRDWLKSEWGIGYDQRNAMVVGFAMGFAVIPSIYSITEDAIFSVPKHLTIGSLALGATPWQTMTKVVLLTASPGIFSAIMIGLGRAVGETMIVLMATGNTPLIDLSIFQGMRTLAANIAVEMPEAEVDSTHYRVLFLAALVLFMFTFVVNTLAEVVRQHLREKYSSL
jgi:phosphate transport system permease protein